ncbi:MAG: hypothetical protein RRC07_14760 [Anaerolineae bacterium]|nr:hypothetical protein [Anaerolineae bacterium]
MGDAPPIDCFADELREEKWGLWEDRYHALTRMIALLQDEVAESAGVNRNRTFSYLLTQLQSFAEGQFKFLHQGLDPRPGNGNYLERSLRYPDDFVINSTVDQVAFDLVVIHGAWNQRILAQNNEPMQRTLQIADQLAYYALLPALRYQLLPFEETQVTVLTYFQKAPHIRMIPYAPIALVGIPFTALADYDEDGPRTVGNAVDLLAIPHEIGHYVYQHGSSKNSRLQNALYAVLQGQPAWLLNWAEEIFADVYGCLIAGPVIVRDFQDLMRDNDVASLIEDDDQHPMPALRPLLYADVLRLLAKKAMGDQKQLARLAEMAEQAESCWKQYLGSRGSQQIEERRGIIQRAIETTFDILTKENPVSMAGQWSPAGEHDTYNTLYARFYDEVVTGDLFTRLKQSEKPSVRKVPPEPTSRWKSPVARIPTLQWLDRIRKNQNQSSTKQDRIPTEVWTLVVSMNGWATDGPQNNPDPKIT